jgi:hypothetical protein
MASRGGPSPAGDSRSTALPHRAVEPGARTPFQSAKGSATSRLSHPAALRGPRWWSASGCRTCRSRHIMSVTDAPRRQFTNHRSRTCAAMHAPARPARRGLCTAPSRSVGLRGRTASGARTRRR